LEKLAEGSEQTFCVQKAVTYWTRHSSLYNRSTSGLCRC